jgi:putative hydrolase of the HAD superfamily
MLYIFDLGNVIVDIDFNRVLGTWSDLTRIPLATLQQHFTMGEAFHQHERGEISDEDFAAAMCHEMNMSLSYEQFSHGWQAVFVALRPEVIAIMQSYASRAYACRLSNTTACTPLSGQDEYPQMRAVATISIFPEMGMRNRKRGSTRASCTRIFLLPIRSSLTITRKYRRATGWDNQYLVTGRKTFPTILCVSYAKNRSSKSNAHLRPSRSPG